MLINRRNGPRYQRVLALRAFLTGAIPKGLILRKFCVWCCVRTDFVVFGEPVVWWLVWRVNKRQIEVCFSPDVILCGWLGSKYQLTNYWSSYKSIPQPWYNPLWLTGLKAPTNLLTVFLARNKTKKSEIGQKLTYAKILTATIYFHANFTFYQIKKAAILSSLSKTQISQIQYFYLQ